MILPKKCTITLEQAQAQMAFNEWNERDDIVILDTETTGLYGEICEISVINRNGDVLFDSLVKPTEPISEQSTNIHSRRIRYLNHRIRELTEEQTELLKKQKQLLQRLVTDEVGKEVAASVSEDPLSATNRA